VIESLRHGYLASVLRKRAEFVQFAGVAIGLAFGVNLLANTLASALSIPAQAVVGGSTVLIVVGVLGWWTFRSVSFSRVIDGCIFVDVEQGVVCGARHYQFSRDVADLLEVAIACNEALRQRWHREATLLINDSAGAKVPWLRDDCRKLVSDAVEMVVFRYLSASLSQNLKHYSDGRFVNSVPPSAFPGLMMSNDLMAAIHARDREMRLTLPVRTLLTRPGANVLRLHSPRFHLEIKVEYRGESATLPPELLSQAFAPCNVKAQVVRVLIHCDVPLAALLRSRQWEYYGWIDLFLSSLDRAEYTSYFFAETRLNVAQGSQEYG